MGEILGPLDQDQDVLICGLDRELRINIAEILSKREFFDVFWKDDGEKVLRVMGGYLGATSQFDTQQDVLKRDL